MGRPPVTIRDEVLVQRTDYGEIACVEVPEEWAGKMVVVCPVDESFVVDSGEYGGAVFCIPPTPGTPPWDTPAAMEAE